MIKNLKKILALLGPYKGRVRVALLAGAVGGVGTGAGFTLGIKYLFSLVFTEERNLETSQLILYGSIFPILALIVGASIFLSGYHLNHAGLSAIRELRHKLFEKLQLLPLAYFQKNKTGDLLARITSDTQVLQYALTIAARDLIVQPLTFLGAVGVLIHLAMESDGVSYVLLSIAILPIVVFPVRHLSKKLGRKATLQQEELSSVTNNITQNLGGVREVRAFNLQEREISRFRIKIEELFRAQMKVIKYTFTLSPVVELISSIGLAVAFVVGYLNHVPGPTFLSIFLALYYSYSPIKRISFLSGEVQKAVSSLDRINQIIDEAVDIEDPKDPIDLKHIEGDIEFRDVSFSYGETAALKNANATIQKGDVCALVGPSGAGKSTFANLVPRFYDVSYGGIFIDGHDVRRFRQNDLREHIAIVSQDPVLFDDTIMENIRLGRQDASDEEVQEAAQQAFAHEFISDQANCPNGYQTNVGERGTRLSGGQKQRIAIARAFLRNAPILILDEATSALDSESERMIQEALDKLVSGKTVLIIAHRFSTIKNANKILVFKDGEIIDEGPHDELYYSCPLYKSLYDQQQS